MKFAFTADVHLSSYSQDRIDDDSKLPERLHSIKNVLYEIADYCIDNQIEYMVLGGDLLHNKSIIYSIAQNVLLEFFRHYQRKLNFIVIDGNHDLSAKGGEAVSALTSLDYEPYVKRIPFGDFERMENMLFVPYSTNIVDIIKKNKSDILISHFGLNEGVLNSGLSIIADLGLKDLIGKYKLVLLGHYHKPQEIIRDDISLFYVGSPIQLDWGEREDEKRFLVVDSQTLEVKSIPTKNYKKHIQLQITKSNKNKILEEAQKAKDAGHYVKLVKTDETDLNDIADQFIVVDKSEKDITNRGLSSSMTDDEIMQKFLDIKEIPKDEHEIYLEIVKDIIS
jgi:DNA repair exonuclease SbcCD nuclease subunit